MRPSQVKEQKEIIILSFSWSNTQKRLGACLKDFSLVFWDSADDFEYQKMFSTGGVTYDFQTEIWYIEFLDAWITTDRSYVLNIWNLEEERVRQQIKSKSIRNQIIDVIEIKFMKLCAVGSLDKTVTIWDFPAGRCLLKIDLVKGGIQSIHFSDCY